MTALKSVLAVKSHASLSSFFQARGPAAPAQGPSCLCALPPKHLRYLSPLSLLLLDCPSSGPLNQFSWFLSYPDKPSSAVLPMWPYK